MSLKHKSVVEHLLACCKALSYISSTTKSKKKKKVTYVDTLENLLHHICIIFIFFRWRVKNRHTKKQSLWFIYYSLSDGCLLRDLQDYNISLRWLEPVGDVFSLLQNVAYIRQDSLPVRSILKSTLLHFWRSQLHIEFLRPVLFVFEGRVRRFITWLGAWE
jgi:hypothetical protein